MSIAYRLMRSGQEEAVATHVRQLSKDLGNARAAAITGEMLRQWQPHVQVMIADNAGLLLGTCIWFFSYSTQRGMKGATITDIYVMSHMRKRMIGQNLLKAVARASAKQGACYLQLNVSEAAPASGAYFEQQGFARDEQALTLTLEPDRFAQWIIE